jgi:hypothetical protein
MVYYRRERRLGRPASLLHDERKQNPGARGNMRQGTFPADSTQIFWHSVQLNLISSLKSAAGYAQVST